VTLLGRADCGATIELDKLPLLGGALDCVEMGIFSSLQPENSRQRQQISAPETIQRRPAWSLLFDPQTSGGLLAAVPAENAVACVATLSKLGYAQASIIGVITDAAASGVTVL
jgi:selenide,water dikinase